jgi:hypothetical protein
MIDKFKIGYYYKFIGPIEKWWGSEEKKIANGIWRKCIKTNCKDYAKLEGMRYGWYWEYEDFIECKYPPKLKILKLLKEIK